MAKKRTISERQAIFNRTGLTPPRTRSAVSRKKPVTDEITTILDVRLPQPHEWDEVLPGELAGLLRSLAKRRATCPDAEVEHIDRQTMRLLLPYRKDRT